MTDFETLPPRLQHLCRQLVAAAGEQHAAREPRSRWWRRPSRGVAAGMAIAALAVPAAAIAATQLITTSQVAASLPQGAMVLMGTDPTCTIVTANVEYRCVLANPPNTSTGGPDVATPNGASNGTTTAPDDWHPPVEAVATAADGKQVLFSQPTLAALQREIAAANVTNVIIAQKGQTLTADTTNGTITITADDTPPATPTDWTGSTELTINSSKHVDGGCRSLNSTGTEWDCYIGEAAVDQNLLAQGLLGQYAPTPSVG